jgi:hypothetical protein
VIPDADDMPQGVRSKSSKEGADQRVAGILPSQTAELPNMGSMMSMRAQAINDVSRWHLAFCGSHSRASHLLRLLGQVPRPDAGVRRVGGLLVPKGVFAFDLYQPNLDYLRTAQTNRLARW